MKPLLPSFRTPATWRGRMLAGLLGLAMAGAMPVFATPPDLTSLLRNSPFGSAAPEPGRRTTGDEPLEFRGLMVDGGRQYFSVHEAKGNRAHWIELDEAGNAFTVRKYDASDGHLTVEYQGDVLTLALKAAVVVGTPAPDSPAQVATAALAPDATRRGNGIGVGPDGARRNSAAILQAHARTRALALAQARAQAASARDQGAAR